LISSIFGFARGLCFNLLGERVNKILKNFKVVVDLRNDVFSALIKKDTGFYDVNKSGELISRISSDIA
jgi:ABC-type multidrug transport system fused ATPase/permease subunit